MTVSAALAVALLYKQTINTHRSDLIFSLDRMSMGANAVVVWAQELLQPGEQSLEGERQHDDLQQAWARQEFSQSFNSMTIQGRIVDVDRYFNINDLWQLTAFNDKKGQTDPNKKNHSAEVTQVLVDLLGHIAEAHSKVQYDPATVAASLFQWFNAGDELSPNFSTGAKMPMASISELRLIEGITPELSELLQQYFFAMPAGLDAQQLNEKATVNINTTTPEILAAILHIGVAEAKSVLDARPFKTMDEVKTAVDNILPKEDEIDLSQWLNVKSRYFLVESRVTYGRRMLSVYTLLKRLDNDQQLIVWQSRSTI